MHTIELGKLAPIKQSSHRILGKTGMHISPIGFGTWAIGGGEWVGGWGPQDDEDSIAAILRALELGVNWIDTAPAYGLGRAERVVGEALRQWNGPQPYIFTKVAIKWRADRSLYNSLQRDSVRGEVEDSLERLGVPSVDLLQIHWPDPVEQIEEGWAALAELRQEGYCRHIGVSNFSVQQMELVSKITPVETLQPPYNLINRAIDYGTLPYCKANDIGVIVYSPMASGLLTGKMTRARIDAFPEDDHRRNEADFQEPNLTRNLEIVDGITNLGRRTGRSAAQIAVAWTLRHPAVHGAIVGARNPRQVEEIVSEHTVQPLSSQDLTEIQWMLSPARR